MWDVAACSHNRAGLLMDFHCFGSGILLTMCSDTLQKPFAIMHKLLAVEGGY